MPRLILLVAIAITIYLLVRRVQRLPPHRRRAGYIQLILGGAALAAVILVATGRMHWIGAALTGALVMARQALPLLVRAFPMLQRLWQRRQSGSSKSQASTVTSAFLRMQLDHETGDLSGHVTDGPFKDWLLDELSEEQLRDLLQFCQQHDVDSAQLLESYIEQRYPNGMAGEQGQENGQHHDGATQGITRSEALAVLGLNDDATDEQIIAAHRSLMQKLHPDRGGNDYLAAKINEAKDFLLG